MAKIGTAHIEVKPVLDEGALEKITERITEAVAEGVRRGLGGTAARAARQVVGWKDGKPVATKVPR